MDITPLGSDDADELAAFAQRRGVVRWGDHLETDPPRVFSSWTGAPDPHSRITLAARFGGALRCAARLSMTARRRKTHTAVIDLIVDWDDGDDAIDACLDALIDTADRWLQLTRLELVAPAGHPRIAGVFAKHAFSVEATAHASIRRDGALRDEARLARITDGAPRQSEWVGPPDPPPRGETPEMTIRPVRPEDAVAWTKTLSEELVVWGTLQLPWQRAELWAERLSSNDPKHVFLLGAEVEGELVGGGVLFTPDVVRRRHAASLGMHVSTPFQGRGVGRRLMAELIDLGARLGCARIELGVYPDNERAVRLYESAGFVREGRHRGSGYRDGALVDELVMARVDARSGNESSS